jgi:hypothetical protein
MIYVPRQNFLFRKKHLLHRADRVRVNLHRVVDVERVAAAHRRDNRSVTVTGKLQNRFVSFHQTFDC